MRIHEIPENIEIAVENMVDPETGECKTQEQINAICRTLSGTFREGITTFAKVVVNESAELKMLQEHNRSIEKQISAKKKRIESLKTYIAFCLKGEKFKSDDALVSISYRTNADVVKIDSLAEIPDEFFKAPHDESHLMKTAIKEALQEGKKVKGVHLEDTQSVIVRG